MRIARLVLFSVFSLVARSALAIDYSPITYGAVGDTKFENDCSTTNGSGAVTCPNAAWLVGDVGKVMWCINTGAAVVNPLIAVTTIASRTSGSQITTTAHANDTVNGTARCAWGTQDDTTAIQAAVAAASSPAAAGAFLTPPGRVLFPCGGFQISGRILDVLDGSTTVPQIVGGGPDCTVLILRPDMTTIPGDGTGALFQATGRDLTFRDFKIEGMFMPFAWNADQDLWRLAQASHVTISRVAIYDLGLASGSANALGLRDVSQAYLENLSFQGAVGSPLFAMKFATVGNVTVVGSLISNFNDNLYISASHGRTPLTAGITWFGGLVDECFVAGGCVQLHDAELAIEGATVYGNPASTSITVDATSRLWISDANVGAFNAIGLTDPLDIAAGGVVVSRGTTWRTNGTGKVSNLGTFIDGGGNNYVNCSGASCTPKTASQSFSGNLPVAGGSAAVFAAAPKAAEQSSSVPFIIIGITLLLLVWIVRRRS